MPFIAEDEYDEYDDPTDRAGSTALGTELARKVATQNVVRTLVNDIAHPKMIVQTVDPLTMMPMSRNLVEGGIEYFNDHESERNFHAAYSIDAILNGDGVMEEMMPDPEPVPNKPVSRPQTSPPRESPPAASPASASMPVPGPGPRELGLDFLQTPPTMPDRQVLIRCEGMVNFQVPFPCHRIVCTDSLVVLVTDVRSTPAFLEMDFQVDRNSVHAVLILPDRTRIPIAAPVPHTVSFVIGVLRCTLFLRDPGGQDEGRKGEG